MIALLLRLLILIAIVYIIYITIRYLTNATRKLEAAHAKQAFYIDDDKGNARKNFFITYKGAMFEGEKYIGNVDGRFVVASIFIDIVDDLQLDGFTRDDFLFLEQHVQERYPEANINWKSTIEQLIGH